MSRVRVFDRKSMDRCQRCQENLTSRLPTHHSLQAWAAMSDGLEHLLVVLTRTVKMTNNDEQRTINIDKPCYVQGIGSAWLTIFDHLDIFGSFGDCLRSRHCSEFALLGVASFRPLFHPRTSKGNPRSFASFNWSCKVVENHRKPTNKAQEVMFACQINQNLKSGYSIDLEMFLLDLVRLFRDEWRNLNAVPLSPSKWIGINWVLMDDFRQIGDQSCLPNYLPVMESTKLMPQFIHIHSQKLRETVLFCFNDAV